MARTKLNAGTGAGRKRLTGLMWRDGKMLRERLDPFVCLRQARCAIFAAPPQVELASLEDQEEDDDQDNSAEADIHKISACIGIGIGIGIGMEMQIKKEHPAFDCRLFRTRTFSAAGDNAD
jgi:hypothetical protein